MKAGRTIDRVVLALPTIGLLGLGATAVAGLAGLGESSQFVGWVIVGPALFIGAVCGVVGLNPEPLLITVHDGWPALSPSGVFVTYFVPAAVFAIVAYRSSRTEHNRLQSSDKTN